MSTSELYTVDCTFELVNDRGSPLSLLFVIIFIIFII